MDRYAPRITVHGDDPLVINVLKVKNVRYAQEKHSPELAIEAQGLYINKLERIIDYLDERYPVPQLISGDLENRTRIRLIADMLMEDPSKCDELAANADPYILKGGITLIDLIVACKTTNERFIKWIKESVNG